MTLLALLLYSHNHNTYHGGDGLRDPRPLTINASRYSEKDPDSNSLPSLLVLYWVHPTHL